MLTQSGFCSSLNISEMLNASCNFAFSLEEHTQSACKYTPLYTEATCPGAFELLQLKWPGFRQGQWHPSARFLQDQVGFVAALMSLHSEKETQNALDSYWSFCSISPKISIPSFSINSYDLTNFPLKQNGFLGFPFTHFMLHVAGQVASYH